MKLLVRVAIVVKFEALQSCNGFPSSGTGVLYQWRTCKRLSGFQTRSEYFFFCKSIILKSVKERATYIPKKNIKSIKSPARVVPHENRVHARCTHHSCCIKISKMKSPARILMSAIADSFWTLGPDR